MSPSFSSLDRCAVADDLREHVRLAQDEDIVDPDLDLGAAVLAEDDLVAFLEIDGDVLAVLVAGARADCEDLAALRLLLRGVRQDDAADRRLLLLEDLDDQPIAKRLQIHLLTSTLVTDLCLPLALYPFECQRAKPSRRI